MTDDRPFTVTGPRPEPRGLRVGVVSVLVALAFLLGLALAVVLVRHQFARDDARAGLVAPDPAPAPTAIASPPPTDAATLGARESVLSGQIAALEARTATLSATAENASGQATRAEALLTALAARRLLDRGQALGAIDGQLLSRFGTSQPRAVAIVRAAARQPVTLEDLREGLDAIGPQVATQASQGWWATARHELATLVVLRRGGTSSPLPADRLARARRLMAADQVEAARAEVAALPGAADAANWLSAARRYIIARQALEVLENAALTGPAPVPAATTPLLP